MKIIKRRERIHAAYVEPAVGLCNCGTEVVLSDPLDNECDNCHLWYNMGGQQVTPSHRCDEQGNPHDGY